MVTVTDYETKLVKTGYKYVFNYDKYTCYSEKDRQSHMNKLVKDGVKIYLAERCTTSPTFKEQKVAVGTREEDHGHYETYIDYYYCDCGAKKQNNTVNK